MADKMKEVIDLYASVEMPKPTIVNPDSKFVVVTYWWGRGNPNVNIQKPCVDDLNDEIKEELEEEYADDTPAFRELLNNIQYLKGRSQTDASVLPELKNKLKERETILADLFRTPNMRAQINTKRQAKEQALQAEGKFTPPRTYDQMIQEWEEALRRVNCNFLSQEIPITDRTMYQYAINLKPFFIKKCLDVCEGRGVLYIDGDMFINKYPAIFDIPNVDFMARGWGIDPRSSKKYKRSVCFDPYIFETSGGSMFYADTKRSRDILDDWIKICAEDENDKKAEDRLLSMVVTENQYTFSSNIIQLPIEYLWLTDSFTFQDPADAKKEDAIIEHPACLTGEERANDTSGSTSREPPRYEEVISDYMDCYGRGGTFYEYVFFSSPDQVETMGPYLNYLKTARLDPPKTNPAGERPLLFKLVEYGNKYGEYNQLAEKNLADAEVIRSRIQQSTTIAQLPTNTPIPEILARLKNGQDVTVGGKPCRPHDDADIVATCNIDPGAKYLTNIIVSDNTPIYFSSKNIIIQHLLAMCSSLADLNIHLKDSYVFASRIRWQINSLPTGGNRKKTYKR